MDITPTLLELGGYDVPPAMQGRSLAAGQLVPSENAGPPLFDEEEIIRNRLSGLGYIAQHGFLSRGTTVEQGFSCQTSDNRPDRFARDELIPGRRPRT